MAVSVRLAQIEDAEHLVRLTAQLGYDITIEDELPEVAARSGKARPAVLHRGRRAPGGVAARNPRRSWQDNVGRLGQIGQQRALDDEERQLAGLPRADHRGDVADRTPGPGSNT